MTAINVPRVKLVFVTPKQKEDYSGSVRPLVLMQIGK